MIEFTRKLIFIFLVFIVLPINQAKATDDLETGTISLSEELRLLNKPRIKLEVKKFSPEALSLEDLIYEAIDRNLDLKISKSDSKNANWAFWQRFSDALPDISADLGVRDLDGTFFLNSQVQADIDESQGFADFRVNYRVFNGGKTSLLILAEKYIKKSAQAQEQNQFNKTVLNAVNLYNKLARQQQSLRSTEKAFDEAKANLKRANDLYEVGSGTYYDVLLTEARQAEAKQSLIFAEKNFRAAQIEIAQFLDFEQDRQFLVAHEEMESFSLVKEKLEFKDLKELLVNNPELIGSEYDEMSARRKKLSNYGEFLPKLDLFYDLTSAGESLGNLNALHTAGLQATLEFGDGLGLRDFSKLKRSSQDLDKAKLIRKQTQTKLELKLRNAYLNYQAAQANIETAEARLKASKEAYRLSQARYDNGIELITDLLSNETNLNQAELDNITAITEFNDAQLELLYLTGDIDLERLLASL